MTLQEALEARRKERETLEQSEQAPQEQPQRPAPVVDPNFVPPRAENTAPLAPAALLPDIANTMAYGYLAYPGGVADLAERHVVGPGRRNPVGAGNVLSGGLPSQPGSVAGDAYLPGAIPPNTEYVRGVMEPIRQKRDEAAERNPYWMMIPEFVGTAFSPGGPASLIGNVLAGGLEYARSPEERVSNALGSGIGTGLLKTAAFLNPRRLWTGARTRAVSREEAEALQLHPEYARRLRENQRLADASNATGLFNVAELTQNPELLAVASDLYRAPGYPAVTMRGKMNEQNQFFQDQVRDFVRGTMSGTDVPVFSTQRGTGTDVMRRAEELQQDAIALRRSQAEPLWRQAELDNAIVEIRPVLQSVYDRLDQVARNSDEGRRLAGYLDKFRAAGTPDEPGAFVTSYTKLDSIRSDLSQALRDLPPAAVNEARQLRIVKDALDEQLVRASSDHGEAMLRWQEYSPGVDYMQNTVGKLLEANRDTPHKFFDDLLSKDNIPDDELEAIGRLFRNTGSGGEALDQAIGMKLNQRLEDILGDPTAPTHVAKLDNPSYPAMLESALVNQNPAVMKRLDKLMTPEQKQNYRRVVNLMRLSIPARPGGIAPRVLGEVATAERQPFVAGGAAVMSPFFTGGELIKRLGNKRTRRILTDVIVNGTPEGVDRALRFDLYRWHQDPNVNRVLGAAARTGARQRGEESYWSF